MRWTAGLAAICLSLPPSAAQEAAPDPLLLNRIKARLAENAQRLPNYTCAETIERSRRLRNTDVFAFQDTLRLDLAFVEGKERFALPGARQFEEKDLRTFITEASVYGGADFTLRATSVLLAGSLSYQRAGAQSLNGRPAIRYDFRVPRETSRRVIRIGSRAAVVGYHGSFWVDAETLDVIRLETAAEEIPGVLELDRATDAIEYRQTRIGEAAFLLPESSELAMTDRNGMEIRSRIRFSGCRAYGVSASVLFGEPVSSTPPAPSRPPVSLPGSAPDQVEIERRPSPPVDPVKAARQELPEDILLLARIKAKASENLQRLPNYTCTETVERTRRGRQARKFEPVDTLRLEVALVDGKELFSWPGAGKFEEKNISEIVGGGAAISNGNFALHAKSVFLSRWPRFTYVGEGALNGRRTIRYDFRVPQMLSGFQIRTGSSEAIVGYQGSFWVDANTLDLIRLEVRADDIPAQLNLAEASDTMEYQRVRIGEVDFLLPESSELSMVDLTGNENRNRTRLSACRQYSGESVLRFSEPVVEPAATAPQPKEIRLPAGLTVEVRLETPIQSGRSARGDIVKAVVARNVVKHGETLAPKGAVVTGRILRLEKHKAREDYYVIGLTFSTIEFDGARGAFRARLQNAGLPQSNRGVPVGQVASLPGPDGDFAVRGSKLSLQRGHVMVWRTE